MNARNMDKWTVALAIAMLALMVATGVVSAQDTTHTVNLPVLGDSFRTWFTESELNAERQQAGYDPAVVSVHTECDLHAASTPDNVLYARCRQHYINGQVTGANTFVLYYLWHGDMRHLHLSAIGSGE